MTCVLTSNTPAGRVFDVTSRRDIFNLNGPYGFCAGRDASRVFATMNVKRAEDITSDVSGLNSVEQKRVMQYYHYFRYACYILTYIIPLTV